MNWRIARTAAGGAAAGLGITLLLATGGPALHAQKREVPPSREVVQYSFAPIVRKAAPAVVNVYVQRRVQTFTSPFANDPFFRQFFGDQFGQPSERVQRSLGSGVIVCPDGIVVTNTHVIKGRGETEIRVALADKREFDAKVVSQDDKTDIAILKIENGDSNFPTIELEDSDTLEVGDMVLAIGNPFGVGQTVTSGIVSALARTEIGASDDQVFIQTDAAINPGNSGGALVDMSGKLVGINTMIFSPVGRLARHRLRHPVQPRAPLRRRRRPGPQGRAPLARRAPRDRDARDRRVAGSRPHRRRRRGPRLRHGPAAEAGLEAGDVIMNVDGFEVTDPRGVQYRLTTRGIGNTVKLDVIRKGQPVTVNLKLAPAPKPGRDDVRNLAGQHPLDGARVSNILPGIADEMGLDDTSGVVVLSVR